MNRLHPPMRVVIAQRFPTLTGFYFFYRNYKDNKKNQYSKDFNVYLNARWKKQFNTHSFLENVLQI